MRFRDVLKPALPTLRLISRLLRRLELRLRSPRQPRPAVIAAAQRGLDSRVAEAEQRLVDRMAQARAERDQQ